MRITGTFYTLGARMGAAGIAFLTVIATTQLLGPAGRGAISLFLATASLLSLLQQMIGGSAVIVLARHYHPATLLLSLYGWNVAFHLLVAAIWIFFNPWSGVPIVWFLVYSLIDNTMIAHTHLLVGHQKLVWDNRIRFFRALLVLVGFVSLAWLEDPADATDYYLAMILSPLMLILWTSQPILRLPTEHRFAIKWPIQLATDGIWAQSARVVQFMSLRVSFFLISSMLGSAALGIYSVGVNMAEVLTIIPHSIAINQYMLLLRQPHSGSGLRSLIRLSWLSAGLVGLALGCATLLPASIYAWAFGASFTPSRSVLISLGPGLVASAMAIPLGYWFHASGLFRQILYCQLIALLGHALLVFPLLHFFGINGAAGATSAGQIILLVLFFTRLRRRRPEVLRAVALITTLRACSRMLRRQSF